MVICRSREASLVPDYTWIKTSRSREEVKSVRLLYHRQAPVFPWLVGEMDCLAAVSPSPKTRHAHVNWALLRSIFLWLLLSSVRRKRRSMVVGEMESEARLVKLREVSRARSPSAGAVQAVRSDKKARAFRSPSKTRFLLKIEAILKVNPNRLPSPRDHPPID